MSTTICFIKILLRFHLKQNTFFSLFKSENWRDILKNITQLLISNFFLAIALWCKRKDSASFYKKIFIFKALVIFWKWKLCCACNARTRGRNCRFFGIELLKIYLISRKVYVFKNPKKVLNHSTLVYSYIDYFLVGLGYSTHHFSCYRPAKNAILSNSLRHLNATTKKYLFLKIFYFVTQHDK